jgi:hypothetical protein
VSFTHAPIVLHPTDGRVSYSTVEGREVFKVTAVPLPPRSSSPVDAMIAELKKQYPRGRDVDVPGVGKGYEFDDLNGDQMHLRQRDLFANDRLYELVVGGRDLDDSHAASFFDSFRTQPIAGTR